MTLGQSIVIGITQGLTEFLPISSTAHLRIVPALLGWDDPGAAFTAVIQLGTLVAVLIYFAPDLARIITAVVGGLRTGRPVGTADAKMGWMIAVGTVPVVGLGLAFKKSIETNWRSLYVVAGAMIGMALVLAVAEWQARRRAKLRALAELGWRDGIVVGLFQAIALVPGSSRSGSTIAGGLFLGMQRETAARFSFLLSMPAVFAAGIFELYHARHELLATTEHIHDLLLATLMAFLVGYASIAFLLGYLKRHTTWVFILYRVALGALLLALLGTGQLRP